MKIDNKGCESVLEDELIEMHVDLEAPNIEAITILLLSTTSSEQQPSHFYFHS